AMPPAVMVPIAMPINATSLQAANHPAGDILARIRFPPAAAILVAYHSNLSNLIGTVVAPERIQRHGRRAGREGDTTGASCQYDDFVGHSDLPLTMMEPNACFDEWLQLQLWHTPRALPRPGICEKPSLFRLGTWRTS